GFLNKLRSQRTFDDQHWQRLWSAVASLTHHNRGALDAWSAYDLAQIVVTVQALGQALRGRTIDSLDTFESEILEANLFLNDLFSR
ncbi:MAG: hypothetical protein JXN59_01310, partial [Anaerolineae bacterium]|nr:hypothetical protein [Anaerolineae bacterium]